MIKFRAVFLREYMERVRRKSFVIGLVLVPLFMAAVTILPAWFASRESTTQETVLILDETGSLKPGLEESLQRELPNGEARFLYYDRTGDFQGSGVDLDAKILSKELDWYLEIPGDVLEEGRAAFHGRIVSNFSLLETLEGRLSSEIRKQKLAELGLDPGLYDKLQTRVHLETFQHSGKDKPSSGFESVFLGTVLFVMILYMTILSFGTMIMRSVLEDKNQRITEVILSCISPTTFFTGKILGIGAVGMTQYLAWAFMALLATLSGGLAAMDLAGLSLIQPLTLFFFVLFYVLGFLFFSGLFAAVGAIATTDQEAQQLMQPLIIIVVVPIIAMMYILQNPDSTVAVVMSMIPLTSPLVMFMRVSLSIPPIWQLLLSIGILIASTALVFVASARIFRVGILITGKRASLAEAWRWVKES